MNRKPIKQQGRVALYHLHHPEEYIVKLDSTPIKSWSFYTLDGALRMFDVITEREERTQK